MTVNGGRLASRRSSIRTRSFTTGKIVVSEQRDGAFAVVDVDTLWRDKNGKDFHWKGRACKGYTKVGGEWKLIMHTGLLNYDKL
jgi:ketosteroid isomerase-like protein